LALCLVLPAAASAAGEEFALEVEVTGEGSGNVGCKVGAGPIEGCEASFPEGTVVTVLAEPEEGSELAEWGGECDTTSGNECKVTMDADKTVEAVFGLEEVELTVETKGSGEGVVECEVEFGPTEPCAEAESYPYGSEVTLYAEAAEGSEFVEWGGDCSGTDPECTLILTEPLSASADFEPGPLVPLNVEEPGTGEGTISCEVDGGPAEACEAEYAQGSEVRMIAKALPGSKFVEWAGECDVLVGNECALTLNEEKTVEVIFEALPLLALNIKLAGTGEGEVQCKVNGSAAKACAAEYPEGTELALVATAKEGSKFAGYSAGKGSASACSTSPCAFTLTAASEVTATFNLAAKFTLKVKKIGTGTGKVESTSPVSPKIVCGTECEKEFDEGTKVTLSQSADPGSEFVKWTGACTGSGACEVTMSAAKEVAAEFKLKATPEFKLTIAKAGTGSGTVTCNAGACASTYPEGSEVTLAASAASGSTFAGWSGGGCSGTGTCKVTIVTDTTVTATFNANPPEKTCATDPSLCPPPPPAGEGVAKVASSAKVKGGKAQLKLTCTGEGACKGSLKLTAKIKSGGKTKNLTIGKGSFSLAKGAKSTLKVKLSGPAKQALSKGPLKAKVKGSGVAASSVKLKA
jgi:hypothetical protein